MAFRVGQKVVCVEVDKTTPDLSLNSIYTISSIRYFTRKESENPGWGVTLAEVMSTPTPEYFAEYRASRFRLAAERPTDISIFTAMLNPSKQTVDVP
jgi:hypothetical protein